MHSNHGRRVRLRFQEFGLDRFPNGRCRARARLDWTQDRSFTGEAEGTQTLEGELRASALAGLRAVAASSEGRLELELRGVKAVRVFDSWVVVVSLVAIALEEGRGERRLMGAYPCPDEDTPRGAVIAVLTAVNRLLERYLEE